ncbi:MAG: helix-turn-helix domain-containing protein [Pseudohongiellaceae bacterium]
MTWLTDFIAALAVSQLICLSLYFLVNYQGLLARLVSLFCFCLGAYVLTTLSVVESNTLPSYLLFRLATLAPLVLWIIASLLFVDGGRISTLAWLAMAYFVVVRGVASAFSIYNPALSDSVLFFVFTQLLTQIILFYFSVHAIYLAQQGYSADLVEERRRLRVVFVTCMGTLVAMIVGSGIVNYFLPNFDIPSAFYSLFIFVAALAFILSSLKLEQEALNLAPRTVVRSRDSLEDSPKESTDPRTVREIRRLMEEEKLYTEPGLTITRLAELLSLQEYRLRRIINHSMRHRNFNQFLNGYRIEDAAERLRGSRLPISNIALDVGYSSLSVFNKAFRDRFGMTPSEYRNKHGGGTDPQPPLAAGKATGQAEIN